MNDLAQRPKRWVKPVDSISIADALETYVCPPNETRGITLIRGFGAFSAKTYSAPVTLPIGIAYLAATLEKAGYKVDLIDGIGENITGLRKSACGKFLYQGLTTDEIVARLKPETRIVGVSMMFSQNWPQYREVCEAIRAARPDVTIVGGGEHVTALPEFVLEDCSAIDYAVTGEGELTLLRLAHAVFTGGDVSALGGLAHRRADGATTHNGLGPRVADFQNLPWPAWDKCKVENYFTGAFSSGIGRGPQHADPGHPRLSLPVYILLQPVHVDDPLPDART